MSPADEKAANAWREIEHALDCDLDCSWRVLGAVKDLLEVGESIDSIIVQVGPL